MSSLAGGAQRGDGSSGGDLQRTESPGDSGIGRSPVGLAGIVITAGFVLVAVVVALYCLIAIWPPSSASLAAPGHLFGVRLSLDRDQQLFMIVALAGALGGLIHSLRSLYWYAGNRVLRRSWLLMYVALPFTSGALAVVFYLILRGGLLTGEATAAQVNFFGFAAVSALVGLFSSEAAEKLREIFSTVLAPAMSGKDRLPQGSDAIAEGFEPGAGPAGTIVTIRGRNLSGVSAVLFHGGGSPATVLSETELRCAVPLGASTGRIRLAAGDRIVSVPGIFRVEE